MVSGPTPPVDVFSRERAALDRAERYFRADTGYPEYENKTLTKRERALMHLALRAYTFPEDTEVAIERQS